MAAESRERKPHRRNYNDPGHAHELTFSCYRRFPFLGRDRACERLVDSIENARRVLQFDVWAWVFMPDHVHLIVHPRRSDYNIATIRRHIKEPVSRRAIAWMRENTAEWLPKIQRTRGTRTEFLFWQPGGGYDRNLTDAATLLKMIDYLHENPCRKQLVGSACDWKWSSALWYVRQQSPPLVPDPIPPEWLVDARLGP